eukprot:TRINITY_DN38473_c0_g1_i1.p1 TRINITY_DN38473_c0_g1~~TRINITY_DN38473_c0_g1_i1.p1  ORF type:complete len:230 (+),score=45.71 TRINITY_DN38473_c0_g1_i1:3-692(+)
MLSVPSAIREVPRTCVRAVGAMVQAMRLVHQLPALPYVLEDGLLPAISARQLDFHYTKHHATYVKKANDLVPGTKWEHTTDLPTIMADTFGDAKQTAIHNNIAQHFNHSFFWNCMKPGGTDVPPALKTEIEKTFGSLQAFKDQFSASALGLFGSGWTWLAYKNGSLQILNYANAGSPVSEGVPPLLTCDVWEHAYYLDHQNRRPEYVENWWKIVNWQFVEKNLKAARVG